MYAAQLPAKPTNAKAIATALKRTAAPKSPLKALRNVLASSDESGWLTLTTTDIEVGQTVTLPGVVGPVDPFVVDLDKLHKMAGVGDVTISPAEGGCVIAAGTIEAKCTTPPAEEYPRLPTFTTDVPGFPVHRLAELVPSMSKDSIRPILCGIYVAADGELAATDSYRLHRIRTGQALDLPDGGIILPGAMVRELVRHKPTEAVTARLTADGRDLSVTVGDVTIFGRIVEGDFPNYNSLIPEPSAMPLAARFADDAPATLRNLSKLAKDSAVPVKIATEGGRMVGTVTVHDDAVYTADLGTTTDDVCVAFNMDYLADLLDGSEAKVVSGVNSLKPWCAFDGDGARLLMPVRVQ